MKRTDIKCLINEAVEELKDLETGAADKGDECKGKFQFGDMVTCKETEAVGVIVKVDTKDDKCEYKVIMKDDASEMTCTDDQIEPYVAADELEIADVEDEGDAAEDKPESASERRHGRRSVREAEAKGNKTTAKGIVSVTLDPNDALEEEIYRLEQTYKVEIEIVDSDGESDMAYANVIITGSAANVKKLMDSGLIDEDEDNEDGEDMDESKRSNKKPIKEAADDDNKDDGDDKGKIGDLDGEKDPDNKTDDGEERLYVGDEVKMPDGRFGIIVSIADKSVLDGSALDPENIPAAGDDGEMGKPEAQEGEILIDGDAGAEADKNLVAEVLIDDSEDIEVFDLTELTLRTMDDVEPEGDDEGLGDDGDDDTEDDDEGK